MDAACNASVDAQIAMRKEVAVAERARKAEAGRAMHADMADLKVKEKLMASKAAEKKLATRAEIVAQMKADAARRFTSGVDEMPERERKFMGLPVA